MKRKSFGTMQCPLARSLERVGDWWNILVLRECFYGSTRFDQFLGSLGIAPSTLARRLDDMVASGLIERRLYSERPPRYDYLLTEAGRDFRPVMLTLLAWGNRHFAPEGTSVELADPESGALLDPIVVDRASGRDIGRARVVPGPAADASIRDRLARAAAVSSQRRAAGKASP